MTAAMRRILAGAVLGIAVAAASSAQTGMDARSRYEEGLDSLEADDPYGAVDFFRSAIRLNPSYADARIGMAEALFLLGEYDESLREIEEARKYALGRRDLELLEGRVLTALRRYDEAGALYGAMLAERPHDAEANRGLAEVYAIVGQKELAEQAFGLSLKYSPGDRRVLLQLVLLHDEARERDRADAAMSEALRLFPDNFEVRIHAAEHSALYGDWISASDHLDRARSMVSRDDSRYRRVGLLDAELSLRRGDAAAALEILEALEDADQPDVLYLAARANRILGNETTAQNRAERLLRIDPEDEIARMFREEALFLSAEGYTDERVAAAGWHLEKGRGYEENFFYQRAYASYRRAKLLAKDNPDVWIAYTNLIRKMGYPEHYRDSLEVALEDIPVDMPEHAVLERRLALLEHSGSGGLAESWGIDDPWSLEAEEWDVGVYVFESGNSLPMHGGAQDTLGLYFADILDANPDMAVAGVGFSAMPSVRTVASFPEAFRDSRSRDDYFALLRFAETERTFSASCEIYLSRTGEMVARYEELRTGRGRVADTLHVLAESVSGDMPRLMRIVAIDGGKVLMNKGRWQGIDSDNPWVAVRSGKARPAIVEGGLEYPAENYLGSVEITALDEPVCEGLYTRSGDFDFIRAGDQVFLLPVPEDVGGTENAPDPAFRARLLAIP